MKMDDFNLEGAQRLATQVIIQTKRDIEAGRTVNAGGAYIKNGLVTKEQKRQAWREFLDNTVWLNFFVGLPAESLYNALDLGGSDYEI